VYYGSIDSAEIRENLAYVKPHVFTAVPRLLEKVFDGILARGEEATGIKKKLFNFAIKTALQWEPDGKNGFVYGIKQKIANIVYKKFREALGGRVMACASGSAALQPRLARFFNAAGIPLVEGYGLTETSPVITVNGFEPGMMRIGTVGKVIDKVEISLANDGEILAKGPNIMMGYYKREDLSNEVLKDGWFHTGDIGTIDKDGFLRITDRKKEMFKTSGGKYIAPQMMENKFKTSRFIEQIVVIGEYQKFPSALIVPAFEVVRAKL
jgi:long-chain acyl-CoA synthetase